MLKEIDLPVLENGQCQDALRTTRFGLELAILWAILDLVHTQSSKEKFNTDWEAASSWTTHSFALAASEGKTLAREMVEAPSSAPATNIPTATSR